MVLNKENKERHLKVGKEHYEDKRKREKVDLERMEHVVGKRNHQETKKKEKVIIERADHKGNERKGEHDHKDEKKEKSESLNKSNFKKKEKGKYFKDWIGNYRFLKGWTVSASDTNHNVFISELDKSKSRGGITQELDLPRSRNARRESKDSKKPLEAVKNSLLRLVESLLNRCALKTESFKDWERST